MIKMWLGGVNSCKIKAVWTMFGRRSLHTNNGWPGDASKTHEEEVEAEVTTKAEVVAGENNNAPNLWQIQCSDTWRSWSKRCGNI